MIKIEIIVDENYVNMDVKGDIKISYPMWGDKKDKQLQKFISDIKKAISGKRISTLS